MYPAGIDAAWIGRDEDGRVALFITAGEAPIPEIALAQFDNALWPEERIAELPRLGGWKIHVTYPKMDSVLVPAERGLFVFDWSDVHRSKAERLDAYELVTSPEREVRIDRKGSIVGVCPENIPVVAGDFTCCVQLIINGVKT